jgi:hypothetical protein
VLRALVGCLAALVLGVTEAAPGANQVGVDPASAAPLVDTQTATRTVTATRTPTRTPTPTATLLPCGLLWRQASSPLSGRQNAFYSVTARTLADAWAVGRTQPTTGAAYRTLIVHWDGATWTGVPSPSVGSGDNVLTGVAAWAADDA